MNKTNTTKTLIILAFTQTPSHANTSNDFVVCGDLHYTAREILLDIDDLKKTTDTMLETLSLDEAKERYSIISKSIDVHKIQAQGLSNGCSHLLRKTKNHTTPCSDKHKDMDVCISKNDSDEDRYTLGFFAQLKEKIQNTSKHIQ